MKRYILLLFIFICVFCTGCTSKNNKKDTSNIDSNKELIIVDTKNIKNYITFSTDPITSLFSEKLYYSITVNCKKPYIIAEEITVKIKIFITVKYHIEIFSPYVQFDQPIYSKICSNIVTVTILPNQSSSYKSGSIETNISNNYTIISNLVTSSVIIFGSGKLLY